MGETLNLCSNTNILTLVYFIKVIITLISIVVPVVLIIMSTVDIVKAVMANDDDERRKVYSKCVKRFVYSFIFYFIPTIINLLFNIIIDMQTFTGTDDYQSALCYNEATPENIKVLLLQKEQQRIKEEEQVNEEMRKKTNEAKSKSEEAANALKKQLEAAKSNQNPQSNSSSNNNSSSNSNNTNTTSKVMLVTGHSPSGADVGGQSEAINTRSLGLEVEKELKKYVQVSIFNRDVMGEDITKNNYNISALEYLMNCNTNDLKYSPTLCSLPNSKRLNNDYDFSSYSYVLELHFNGAGGPGTFITSANSCSDSQDKSGCRQQSDNAQKLSSITNSIMKYMKDTGIGYNASSHNGIRDDWYAIERYVRVSTNYKTPASLMEVCATDVPSDMNIFNNNKNKIAKAIAHGIVEGLGLQWNE